MRLLFVLLVAGSAFGFSNAEDLPSLEGAKVYRLIPDTDEKLSAVLAHHGKEGYDILRRGHVLGDEIRILVTADYVEAFETELTEYEIDNVIEIENAQEVIDEEKTRQSVGPSITHVNGRISFEAYPRYDAVLEYLQELATNYSSIATVVNIGTSYEGRPISGLKISSGGTGKPAILIDSAMHAREWIAPTSALYAINQLVENSENSDLYASVDWYIFPVANPDGYEFTHTNYRLWRKTRSINTGSSCRGVDPNRNFGYYWMLNGASDLPCSDIYAGTEAFSEVETQALRDFVLANNETIKLYLAVHSYGNYFLYPWGYTADLPDNEEELRTLAEAADDALSTLRGTRYTIGTSTNVLYEAAGGSDDWVKGVGGVELSYTPELTGGGIFGFDPPVSEILPIGQEFFLATRVFGEYIAEKFGSSK
ncbi:carboxypeptidase B-like [Diprion similis]|uniref:carboxypeptidase B-like n=1 Tax=Diprion similis TaxID=362088 RepID=UPI001EF816D8|nr:carboxypeptidase B-like [Diprion similis]